MARIQYMRKTRGKYVRTFLKDDNNTPWYKFNCNFILGLAQLYIAAPWRRMPVVLKEDLGLSSLGLTGSRGMLQYGVAFMKIISRRSNDRLFDNPIRGETYTTCQLLRIQTPYLSALDFCKIPVWNMYRVWWTWFFFPEWTLYLLPM